jgi:hypothetical protein
MTFGPDLVTKAEEIVHHIQSNLKAAKSRHEHYAIKRRRPLTFTVVDHVYLRVSPVRGVKMFGIKGKLAPEPWLISWSCRHPWRVCMMCSMYPAKEMLEGIC